MLWLPLLHEQGQEQRTKCSCSSPRHVQGGAGKHKYLFVPQELCAAHVHHQGCVWEWGNRSVS